MFTTTHSAIVLRSSEVDCDGIGHAWRRIYVPASLADLLLDELRSNEIHLACRKAAQTEMLDALRAAPEWNDEVEAQIERLTHERDEHDRMHRLHGTKADALSEAAKAFAVDTEQLSSYGDWWAMSREETEAFEADLAEEGTVFDREYWDTEGYHSQFIAR